MCGVIGKGIKYGYDDNFVICSQHGIGIYGAAYFAFSFFFLVLENDTSMRTYLKCVYYVSN